MNTIKFKAYEYNGEGKGLYLEILIDGIPLQEIMEREVARYNYKWREYEGHRGGPHDVLKFGPIEVPFNAKYYFLGLKNRNHFFSDYTGNKPVLYCACGNEGCGNVYCKIIVNEDKVIWSDFVGRYVGIAEVGQFVFDEEQYHQEISVLPTYEKWRRVR